MIDAEIIADSISPFGNRLTTYVLKYPRFIHSELMTHRVFSRNAASSRAIPITKVIETVRRETGRPSIWGRNKPGMQAKEVLTPPEEQAARQVWDEAMADAIRHAERLNAMGVHKQITNRLLEPFTHMVTLVTATELTNFFSLRAHSDAQPEFQILAYRMLGKYLNSTPVAKEFGEWHIPFGDKMPAGLSVTVRLKIAVARAARISYKTFDGEIDVTKDIELHDRLAESGHWSPFEHVAKAMGCRTCGAAAAKFHRNQFYGNFRGWKAYRKEFLNENRTEVDLHEIYINRPAVVDFY